MLKFKLGKLDQLLIKKHGLVLWYKVVERGGDGANNGPRMFFFFS